MSGNIELSAACCEVVILKDTAAGMNVFDEKHDVEFVVVVAAVKAASHITWHTRCLEREICESVCL